MSSFYDPESELDKLGIPIQYIQLNDVLATWDPESGKVYCSTGLSPMQKRCALTHEVAHITLKHRRCSYLATEDATTVAAVAQERGAEMWAARKLVSAVQLAAARECGLPPTVVARELGVTLRVYRARLLAEHQDEQRWLGNLDELVGV
ncbi:ImmA/IrrE family metallo-endopeptidase [Streptomyces sp. WZ-12]|uniref:ImmA/IrrE family metallo-endopeptidase n=1 Tax=Streptomyces sp. WZ-12 TaxID=3030210 RepID=UPI002381937E|nr:ImmA/IrrE family metallo-endopeptidase [Streptomyces sp. WZ-12]